MRLVLVDRVEQVRGNFYPLTLSRPLWELRCGISSLRDKLVARLGIQRIAHFVPDYMAEAYRAKAEHPVNDLSILGDDDLLVVDPRVKADSFDVASSGPSEVGLDKQGNVLYARIARADTGKLAKDNIDKFLDSAKARLANIICSLPTWQYTWDLILANSDQIIADFAAAGYSGIEGTVEQPSVIRGSRKDVYIARGAKIHPMVVIDTEQGPVYIDEEAQIQPFSRIEGPCYIGKQTILLGAKCREGNSIGPACRIGGEIEQSIIQGYSNKYHDGFLGHSYIGEWVNLGALTTNSDLKNDYSSVSIILDGRQTIDTGSTKVGALIGDHTKTSIGTLLNTGSYIGAMAVIVTTGKLLPKFIPSFAWFVEGVMTKGFGKRRLYETAKMVMSRRGCEWSDAEQAMWEAVYEMTAPARETIIKRNLRAMLK
jgi:UDP-N-acetylglucosamine diphosphorylase/glucosamine-1-phosphate N-acetyltransferase